MNFSIFVYRTICVSQNMNIENLLTFRFCSNVYILIDVFGVVLCVIVSVRLPYQLLHSDFVLTINIPLIASLMTLCRSQKPQTLRT